MIQPGTRSYVEETPCTWTVNRLFRCSFCSELFAVPSAQGAPRECPRCKMPFETEARRLA